MEFRILGPLELVENGHAVDIGGTKQAALLAMLLLHANEIVSSDRLIDALWPARPPETAPKAIQVYVSELRKLVGRGRLLTKAPGYLLRLGRDELDLDRFEALLSEARKQEGESAAAKLREALALWRGPPLAEFADHGFAQSEIAHLEELRISCVEERVDADLAAGRHTELVGELEALVKEYPLRERSRSQLMLALYRSGRQAEALQTYQDARRLLVEQLGIEPSRQLRDLHQAVLNQDAALDLAAERGDATEATTGAFVGRERELDELVRGLNDSFAGRGRLFLVAGEPGIGKSRLADELAVHARKRGARAVVGRCWEAGGAPAYWPWVQSLRACFAETGVEALREQLSTGAADLAQLLPELREAMPDLADPLPLEAETARFRLFEAVSAFLRRAAETRPVLLVLDDLHAADEPSLLMLRFLARELGDSRVLVVAAYRDVDPTVRDPLSATLAELAREPVTRRIELTGLLESDVAEFIARTTKLTPDRAVVAEIHAETEGNPLFVEEVTRFLLREGALEAGVSPAGIRIPQGVRDVIGRRLGRLPDESQRVLTLASVLGREFPIGALARLSECSETALLDALDEAMAARIVEDVTDAPSRLRFAHVLFRDTLYQGLTAGRRLRLHRQAGAVLENFYGDESESHLAELAYHFAEAAPAGDAGKAVDYARRAGDRAAMLLAFEEAARLYRLALTLIHTEEAAENRRTRCELLVRLGDVQARGGDMPAARETFLRAAELARATGWGELLARAALGYGGRFIFTRAADDDRVVPLLKEAAQALDQEQSSLRVRVLARLACALSQHEPDTSKAVSAEALDLARKLDDPATLAYAISGRLWATRAPLDLDERWALSGELIQAGDKERVFEGHGSRLMILLARGDIPGVRRELAAQSQLADELGQPSQRWWTQAHRATLALLEGRLSDAERLIADARDLGERAQSYDAVNYFRLQRFALRREQGRLHEVQTDFERAVEDDPGRPLLRCALATVYWELGKYEQARRLFDEITSDLSQLTPNNDCLLAAALLAEIAAEAEDSERADALYGWLSPCDGLNVDTVEVSTGAVSRYLGQLAATGKRFDQAEDHFASSLAMNERMGARPWYAHTQEDYARTLLARRKRADRKQAAELVAAAHATYSELGMKSHAARASALMQQLSARI
jgi:DNA-binding SARP family transcriptional activator